jgi:hypothetical protein
MKTNKIFLTFFFVLANLLTYSQIKVLSNGKIAAGAGTDNNSARLNISDNNNCTIYSKAFFNSYGWGDAIKSQVDRSDAIAFSAYYNNDRNFMVFGDGNVRCVDLYETSDSTLKENIATITSALEKVKQLRGVSYQWKASDKDKNENKIGLIAQEVEKVIPEVIQTSPEGQKAISYSKLVALLIEAIKDQQIQIEELKVQIEDCCKNKESLKSASIATYLTENLTGNKAQLDQNIPNPFSQGTKIGCFIPDGSTASMLYIYNMNGTQLQQYNINGKGKQTVTINGNSFVPGMYLYALVIDGREVDTKRMILTK